MSYPRRFAVVFVSAGITYLVADALAAWIAGVSPDTTRTTSPRTREVPGCNTGAGFPRMGSTTTTP